MAASQSLFFLSFSLLVVYFLKHQNGEEWDQNMCGTLRACPINWENMYSHRESFDSCSFSFVVLLSWYPACLSTQDSSPLITLFCSLSKPSFLPLSYYWRQNLCSLLLVASISCCALVSWLIWSLLGISYSMWQNQMVPYSLLRKLLYPLSCGNFLPLAVNL